jgi:hypothetical protein
MLHRLPHIQLTSNAFPGKRTRLLLGRLVLVAEYQTSMKSV